VMRMLVTKLPSPPAANVVALRYRTHPLHSKLLKRVEQVTEVVPCQLTRDWRRRGAGCRSIGVNNRSGNHLLVREEVRFATSRLDAHAGPRSFTLPARWSQRAVGFDGLRWRFIWSNGWGLRKALLQVRIATLAEAAGELPSSAYAMQA
jgi:hypothetical protein